MSSEASFISKLYSIFSKDNEIFDDQEVAECCDWCAFY